ncbi:DUF1634 domain-containing protein [Ihuprevotella massiliensis]|uniref:DUF1634 domain-containing protein n=1 Tax=Ihuprevotella massiliensis TaxID=1852368 RepID=UPI00094EC403
MDIQQLIGNTLRWGVILACLLATIGGVYYLMEHGLDPVPDYRHFDIASAAAQTNYTTLGGLWQGILHDDAASCVQVGVIVLILTPIARVVLSLFDFIVEQDWLYVSITAIVLAVIISNSLGGVH